MSDPCVLSIIARGYKLCFMSPPLLLKTPWEIISPQGPQNVRANIPDASKECDNKRTSGYSRILFKRISGTQSFRRVASSNKLKQLNAQIEAPHFRMHTITCSSVLSSVKREDYAFK